MPWLYEALFNAHKGTILNVMEGEEGLGIFSEIFVRVFSKGAYKINILPKSAKSMGKGGGDAPRLLPQ